MSSDYPSLKFKRSRAWVMFNDKQKRVYRARGAPGVSFIRENNKYVAIPRSYTTSYSKAVPCKKLPLNKCQKKRKCMLAENEKGKQICKAMPHFYWDRLDHSNMKMLREAGNVKNLRMIPRAKLLQLSKQYPQFFVFEPVTVLPRVDRTRKLVNEAIKKGVTLVKTKAAPATVSISDIAVDLKEHPNASAVNAIKAIIVTKSALDLAEKKLEKSGALVKSEPESEPESESESEPESEPESESESESESEPESQSEPESEPEPLRGLPMAKASGSTGDIIKAIEVKRKLKFFPELTTLPTLQRRLVKTLLVKATEDDIAASGADLSEEQIANLLNEALKDIDKFTYSGSVCDYLIQNYLLPSTVSSLRLEIANRLLAGTGRLASKKRFNLGQMVTDDFLKHTLDLYDELFFKSQLTVGVRQTTFTRTKVGISALKLAPSFGNSDELAALDPPQMYFSAMWFQNLFPGGSALFNKAYLIYGHPVREAIVAYLMLFEHKLMNIVRKRVCAYFKMGNVKSGGTAGDVTKQLKKAEPHIATAIGNTDLIFRMMARNTFGHLTFEELPTRDDQKLPVVRGDDKIALYKQLLAAQQIPKEVDVEEGDYIAVFDMATGLGYGKVTKTVTPSFYQLLSTKCITFQRQILATTETLEDQQKPEPETLCGVERYVKLTTDQVDMLNDIHGTSEWYEPEEPEEQKKPEESKESEEDR